MTYHVETASHILNCRISKQTSFFIRVSYNLIRGLIQFHCHNLSYNLNFWSKNPFLTYPGGQKSNGSAIPITVRNRPRIPTPDVTKEVLDRERLGMSVQSMGVIMAHQNEMPVLGALVLSPIQVCCCVFLPFTD